MRLFSWLQSFPKVLFDELKHRFGIKPKYWMHMKNFEILDLNHKMEIIDAMLSYANDVKTCMEIYRKDFITNRRLYELLEERQLIYGICYYMDKRLTVSSGMFFRQGDWNLFSEIGGKNGMDLISPTMNDMKQNFEQSKSVKETIKMIDMCYLKRIRVISKIITDIMYPVMASDNVLNSMIYPTYGAMITDYKPKNKKYGKE